MAWDELDGEALDKFTKTLVGVLDSERRKVAGKAAFQRAVVEAGTIDVRAVTVTYGDTAFQAETHSTLTAVAQNVDHAFAEAGRKVGGGLHLAYLHHRITRKNALTVSAVKLELYALLQDPAVLEAIEQRAEVLLGATLDRYKVAVMDLPDERRQHYRQVRRQATRPTPGSLGSCRTESETFKEGNSNDKRHLYADDRGDFHCQLNKWEQQVIAEALAEKGVVGWLRNEPRKLWAFAVPYSDGKQDRPLYPDFLIFRKKGAGIVCDVLEAALPGLGRQPRQGCRACRVRT